MYTVWIILRFDVCLRRKYGKTVFSVVNLFRISVNDGVANLTSLLRCNRFERGQLACKGTQSVHKLTGANWNTRSFDEDIAIFWKTGIIFQNTSENGDSLP